MAASPPSAAAGDKLRPASHTAWTGSKTGSGAPVQSRAHGAVLDRHRGTQAEPGARTDARGRRLRRARTDGALTGHIVVSAPSRLGEVCVALVVSAFLHAHPRVSIDLHLTDAVQNLDRDRIDLAVRIGSSGEDHHVIRRIADNHRLLVASPRYLERRPIACVEDLDVCDGLLLGNAPTWRLQGPNGRIHIARPRGG